MREAGQVASTGGGIGDALGAQEEGGAGSLVGGLGGAEIGGGFTGAADLVEQLDFAVGQVGERQESGLCCLGQATRFVGLPQPTQRGDAHGLRLQRVGREGLTLLGSEARVRFRSGVVGVRELGAGPSGERHAAEGRTKRLVQHVIDIG
ncbi:hypothetical protein [Haliangium sp. UPWRP_2]|uniref:hypothetical protein n=1 Tax=Haliangium sp. UPWRP_2 TaxID=1931276 RepID=UPI0011B28F1B|nr:hypothetical protein [Haliangium sp. UPWRP_2]